jgi:XTP/dITP diphosphohydrolase
MDKLVFATHNKHKLEEIKQILFPKFTVLGLDDIGFTDEIHETGTTLQENASIKSEVVFNKFEIDCFSDDTGLLVDALDGAPGVYSARYSGENATYESNVEKLLSELNGVENRKAHFSTIISLRFNGKEYFFEGRVDGEIIYEPRGNSGFGYDPVFKPEGYDQTFAEMSSEVKNEISHRARAVKKLVDFLMSSTV